MSPSSRAALLIALASSACGTTLTTTDTTGTPTVTTPTTPTGTTPTGTIPTTTTSTTTTTTMPPPKIPMIPDGYWVDLVATAAGASDMNDFGDMTGTSYRDTGCGSFCLPPQDTVAWVGPDRLVLPALPGLLGIYVTAMDNSGVIAGFAGFPGTTTHAVIWEPGVAGYTVTDLGTLPGATRSDVAGMDETGRVVGWSMDGFFPPTVAAPYVWDAVNGMADLAAQGFPDEPIRSISPAGMVATMSHWYDVGDPLSVETLVPPAGYVLSNYSAVINDAGQQARVLLDTTGSPLLHLFRYDPSGTWELLTPVSAGSLTPTGVGGIDENGTVTSTVLGAAQIAWGPDGLSENLVDYVSPAYGAPFVGGAGKVSASGVIPASVAIGASQRLVRLVPAMACTGSCLHVDAIAMTADFVEAPAHPGQCRQNGSEHNEMEATVTVTDAAGAALADVEVTAHFLDDYWTDHAFTLTTDASGQATFTDTGPCGVGTIAFIVTEAVKSGYTFDRLTGTLVASQIPL